ncbi:porin [Pseudothioclava nitratireducens]|uniref:porin n=1 Tax=Pseudothioclava nitratireducens TaxID=1928646 RepID=UPI0023DC223A|nr:porin [Defluviimonas nitratireducens]MDF1620359.1 porin [Defluviimonas nitratireducens]
MVFSAGIAAAEVTISGSANAGFKYNSEGNTFAGKKAAGWYEIDMDVTGTAETDTGLTFGARIQLDSDYATVLDDASDDNDVVGNVFVSGAFGTFTIGSGLDPVSDDDTLSDIGLDGIGIDDVAEAYAYDGSADARWDYSVGALTIGASVNTVEEDYAVKVGYDFGTVAIAVAYDNDEGGEDTTQVKLSGGMGAFSGQVFYATQDAGDSFGLYGAYKTGALTLSAAYGKSSPDVGVDRDAFGVGAAYDLGGATVAGGIGRIEKATGDETVADLGVSFKF